MADTATGTKEGTKEVAKGDGVSVKAKIPAGFIAFGSFAVFAVCGGWNKVKRFSQDADNDTSIKLFFVDYLSCPSPNRILGYFYRQKEGPRSNGLYRGNGALGCLEYFDACIYSISNVRGDFDCILPSSRLAGHCHWCPGSLCVDLLQYVRHAAPLFLPRCIQGQPWCYNTTGGGCMSRLPIRSHMVVL